MTCFCGGALMDPFRCFAGRDGPSRGSERTWRRRKKQKRCSRRKRLRLGWCMVSGCRRSLVISALFSFLPFFCFQVWLALRVNSLRSSSKLSQFDVSQKQPSFQHHPWRVPSKSLGSRLIGAHVLEAPGHFLRNGMPQTEEQWTAWFQWMKSGNLEDESIRSFYQDPWSESSWLASSELQSTCFFVFLLLRGSFPRGGDLSQAANKLRLTECCSGRLRNTCWLETSHRAGLNDSAAAASPLEKPVRQSWELLKSYAKPSNTLLTLSLKAPE